MFLFAVNISSEWYNIVDSSITSITFMIGIKPFSASCSAKLLKSCFSTRACEDIHVKTKCLRGCWWPLWSSRWAWWRGCRRRTGPGARSLCPSSPRRRGTSGPTAPGTPGGRRSLPVRRTFQCLPGTSRTTTYCLLLRSWTEPPQQRRWLVLCGHRVEKHADISLLWRPQIH